MVDTWILFDGDNGLNQIFNDEINKSKKHMRDDALVPFRTKTDKKQYTDFSGVLGAFSRIMSSTTIKGGVDRDSFRRSMKEKIGEDCSEENFEKLFEIVENIYFKEGKLMPVNIKSLNYIDSNITQQQVAEYLYSLFIEDTDLNIKFEKMEASEDTNILEKLVFDSLSEGKTETGKIVQNADCFLPYVKNVFIADFEILINDTNLYQKYINRFLAYYYMFYVSQLAVKLCKFENGKRDEIEEIYMTLYEEPVTKVRSGYEYGWKYVKEQISHMFSHSVLLEMLSHNVDGEHNDYIGFYDKFCNSEDDGIVSEEVKNIRTKYMEWIPMDYSLCKHNESKDSDCKTSNEIKKLFEIIDFQFINGGRKSHYNGYNKKYIDFVQKNFGKFRGTCGYTLSPHESDIIMFTQIILRENNGKIKLSKLFEEFKNRGLLFDRDSRKKIIELYEKMNLLEKRSDSGDAQYVKDIL